MSGAQERVRRMALLNQTPLPLPSAITYGKPRGKPIPLRGNHFLRPGPYDLPVDEDEEPPVTPRKVRFGKIYSAKQPNPDDSPLSEDELEAVYGRDASPMSSPPASLSLPRSRPIVGGQQALSVRSAISPKRRSIPQPARPTRPAFGTSTNPSSAPYNISVRPARQTKRTILQQTPATSHGGGIKKGFTKPTHYLRPLTHVSSMTPASSSGVAVTRHTCGKDIPSNQTPLMDGRPTRPRLNVSKLLLANSPSQAGLTSNTLSSLPGPEALGSVSCSPVKQQQVTSQVSNDLSSLTEAPLTSIRKRLKTPKYTHKSVVALRNKRKARAPFFKTSKYTRTVGDGFEEAELAVTHPAIFFKKQRTRRPLMIGISALTLQAGPLPDVDFSSNNMELKLEPSHGDDDPSVTHEHARPGEGTSGEAASAERPPHRTIGFSDRVLDEMVAQRLSSVSAPKRVYSISSDDGEDENFEEDADWNQSEVEPDEEAEGEDNGFAERSSPGAPAGNQDADFCRRSLTLPMPSEPTPNHGVMLDFRKSSTPGTVPKVPFDKRHLIEVDEEIIDGPDVHNPPASADIDNFGKSYQPPAHTARNANQKTSVKQHRPWSIMRRKTPTVQQGDTSPAHTAVNTRRNSVRVMGNSHYFQPSSGVEDGSDEASSRSECPEYARRNTEVSLDGTRYFSNSAGMLREQDQSRPRIIKQRSSEARRASYFSQPEVLVLDSDAAVSETSTAVHKPSLALPDFTNLSKLHALKGNCDFSWPFSPPKASKDLKTLTRTVSQDHGTLSQSARSRSSLPFHSPLKVR